jgi:isocitrate dehydrogenase
MMLDRLLIQNFLGIAPGVNTNYRTGRAVFEAAHGTAPGIAGKNIANP